MDYLLKPRVSATQRYAFIGIPHDSATSLGNPGARFAPAELRAMLKSVFDWRLRDGRLADMDEGVIDLSAVEVLDYGDVALSYHDGGKVLEQTQSLVGRALADGCVPLIVGGDHAITYPPVKALHDARGGNIGLIQLDAHNDLMDFSERQGKFSGSSCMRRSLELPRLHPANLVQIGLRGYATLEQFEIGQTLGVRRIGATRFAQIGARAAAEQPSPGRAKTPTRSI